MANYERGVYEPSDEVRVFDGSEEEDDVEGSRLPLLIVLALLVLAMFGGVVWLAYTQGVARGRGETPVLTAANGPEKVAPSQPGGANTPYQGFKIYEQPAPPDDSGDAAPAANTTAPKPAPVAAAPAPAPPAAEAAKQAKPAPQAIVAAPPPAKPAPQAATPVAKPVAQAAAPKPAAKSPPPALKPTTSGAPAPKTMDALIRQAENLPAKPAPAAAAPAGGPASGAPRQLGNPVPVTPAPKPATAAPAASGGSVLQIGAYKSQADADTAWKAYKAKHPLAAGYSEDVAKVDLGEKGTWYRLRMAGFGDKDQASATCAKLKAEGGDCMLAK